MAEPWLIRFFACNREMQPFSFFFVIRCGAGAGAGDFGSGSGSKFNCAARVGSGRVRRSRVRAGFGLQFWARADLYFNFTTFERQISYFLLRYIFIKVPKSKLESRYM